MGLFFRVIPLLFCSLSFFSVQVNAAMELTMAGGKSVRVEDVYREQGQNYLALDDVLPVLGLRGWWDSVGHYYRIRGPLGRALISPGSQYLQLGNNKFPLETPPRFIDGKLRVTDDFIRSFLGMLADRPVFLRNLDPVRIKEDEEKVLERFFGVRLKDNQSADGEKGAIIIDPAHGGDDPGCIGRGGVTEKRITLEISEKLARLLKMHLDRPVILLRNGDYSLTADQRRELLVKQPVEMLLQIHAQSDFSGRGEGIEIYFRSGYMRHQIPFKKSRQLALFLAAAIHDSGLQVSVPQTALLQSLDQQKLPTVLLEVGYLSNPVELLRLQNEEEQQHLIEAIYAGVLQFIKEEEKTK